MPAPDDAVPGGLQVISRAAQILRMLDAQRPEVRINEVAAELGIGRTSAYRYLQSLAVEGFLDRVGDGGSYRLGPLLAGLGASVLSESGVIEVAGPFLEQLAGATAETAVLGIWNGAGAVAVMCKEPPGKTVNMTVRIGAPLSAEAAQSIVFLAHQAHRQTVDHVLRRVSAEARQRIEAEVERVLDDGYASSDAVVSGAAAVAAPVFDSSGWVVATVALVAPTAVLQTAPDTPGVCALLATARSVSRQLGHPGLTAEPGAVAGG